MKNDQQEPDLKPLWGLRSKPLTDKPKEERILDTVNRVISRIQNDERNCSWRNTLTRLAYGCPLPSRKTWLKSVMSIRSMSQTWWDVRLHSSFISGIVFPVCKHCSSPSLKHAWSSSNSSIQWNITYKWGNSIVAILTPCTCLFHIMTRSTKVWTYVYILWISLLQCPCQTNT